MVEKDKGSVMQVDEPEFLELDLTWDTACQKHVADKADLPGYEVMPNEMSRRGGTFNAANNSEMECEGEVTLYITEDGKTTTGVSTMNVTTVNRPLWSIGTILDNQSDDGCYAVFRKRRAEICNPGGLVMATAYRQPGGLWVGRVKVRNPRHPSFKKPDFIRP